MTTEGLPSISQLAMNSCIQRICPVVKSPTRLKQGSNDPPSAWAIAQKKKSAVSVAPKICKIGRYTGC